MWKDSVIGAKANSRRLLDWLDVLGSIVGSLVGCALTAWAMEDWDVRTFIYTSGGVAVSGLSFTFLWRKWKRSRGVYTLLPFLLLPLLSSCASTTPSPLLHHPCVETGVGIPTPSPQPSSLHCLISSLASHLSTLETGYELAMRGAGEGRQAGWVKEEEYALLIEQGRKVEQGLKTGWGLLATAKRLELIGEGGKGVGDLWTGVAEVAKELGELIEMTKKEKEN